jgi:Asp-tRNA(Asn)/Glu-tRNA(Gln) amidotransferase A subunit family amidase
MALPDVSTMADLVRRGEVSARSLVEQSLDRIEAGDRSLTARMGE